MKNQFKNEIFEALVEVTDRGITFERKEDFFVKKGSNQEQIILLGIVNFNINKKEEL